MSFRLRAVAGLAAGLIAAMATPAAALQHDAAVPRAQRLIVGKVSDEPKKAHPPLVALSEYLLRHAAAGFTAASVVLAPTAREMSRILARGEVDIISDTLFSALTYERGAGAEIALREWKKGVASYRTFFVARADSDIRSLADLRGRGLVFENESSTSAYHVPRAILQQLGYRLERAGSAPPSAAGALGYEFAGGEINVVTWVHRGRADVGTISNLDWDDPTRTPEAARRDLRIIHQSPPVTRAVMAFRRGLDPAAREALVRTLTAMHEDATGKGILERFFGVAKYDRFVGEAKESLDASRALLEPLLE